MTLRYPLPLNWDAELDRLDALNNDEMGDRLDEIDRMATLAGVSTAYVEPTQPEPRWHSILAMILWPGTALCMVWILYGVFG